MLFPSQIDLGAGILVGRLGASYSAVSAGGLDTLPLPVDIGEEPLARILGDVASLAYKWRKPLAAHPLPAPGKKAGDRTVFDDARMANTIVR